MDKKAYKRNRARLMKTLEVVVLKDGEEKTVWKPNPVSGKSMRHIVAACYGKLPDDIKNVTGLDAYWAGWDRPKFNVHRKYYFAAYIENGEVTLYPQRVW